LTLIDAWLTLIDAWLTLVDVLLLACYASSITATKALPRRSLFQPLARTSGAGYRPVGGREASIDVSTSID
jgi:hypothetical protein